MSGNEWAAFLMFVKTVGYQLKFRNRIARAVFGGQSVKPTTVFVCRVLVERKIEGLAD